MLASYSLVRQFKFKGRGNNSKRLLSKHFSNGMMDCFVIIILLLVSTASDPLSSYVRLKMAIGQMLSLMLINIGDRSWD